MAVMSVLAGLSNQWRERSFLIWSGVGLWAMGVSLGVGSETQHDRAGPAATQGDRRYRATLQHTGFHESHCTGPLPWQCPSWASHACRRRAAKRNRCGPVVPPCLLLLGRRGVLLGGGGFRRRRIGGLLRVHGLHAEAEQAPL